MSFRTLDTIGGSNGGPAKVAGDPGRARNVHVTLSNSTPNDHIVFFGRSRREVGTAPPGVYSQFGQGFAVMAIANLGGIGVGDPDTGTIVGTGGFPNVNYTSALLEGWTGELWAVTDAANAVGLHVVDGGSPEQ